MIKILLWLIVISIVIFSIFGFLVLIEYMRYFKRKLHIYLMTSLDNYHLSKIEQVSEDD